MYIRTHRRTLTFYLVVPDVTNYVVWCVCIVYCIIGDHQLPGGPSGEAGYQQQEEGRPGMVWYTIGLN